jgi:hypothetical protein
MNQDKRSWAVLKRAFSIWQQTPHKVSPINKQTQICQSCGTTYEGNYCPRCGQSARVGRFSFKTALLLFLDIWGMGNRGMFRSFRDLLLRPGYMIRDYVSGRQSAYFPPFKMFFILTTLSLLLSHGFSLDLEKTDNEGMKVEVSNKDQQSDDNDDLITKNGKPLTSTTLNSIQKGTKLLQALDRKSPALSSFLLLVLLSAPLYLFLRRCPNIPDLRYSEHLVALVYTANMYSIYRSLGILMPPFIENLLQIVAIVMIFYAMKQFTGYSKRRLLWYAFLTALICAIAICAAISLAVVIVYYLS